MGHRINHPHELMGAFHYIIINNYFGLNFQKFPWTKKHFPCHLTSLPEFQKFLVQWFAFWKIFYNSRFSGNIPGKFSHNRPFPSSLVPLFQSESKCETFHMKMSSACSFFFMQIKVIFIRMVLHLDSLWNRGTRPIGNGLFLNFWTPMLEVWIYQFRYIKISGLSFHSLI